MKWLSLIAETQFHFFIDFACFGKRLFYGNALDLYYHVRFMFLSDFNIFTFDGTILCMTLGMARDLYRRCK